MNGPQWRRLTTHHSLHAIAPVERERGLFLSLTCILLGCGILMVHSASITSWPTEFERVYLSRHLTFLSLGALAAAVCSLMPVRFWLRAAPWLLAVTLGLLLLVFVPGVGVRVNGAQRWLRLGPLTMQPSELAKITLPLMVCRLAWRRRTRLNGWWGGTLPLLWPILLVVPLVLRQPDLGTSLFLVGGATVALFVSGWPLRHFLALAGLATPLLVSLVALRPYQLRRITGFLAAWADWSEAPYQLQQSLMSLGAGGLFGVGLGKGWQKLSFLPEANTDFVFAVVGEELGLVGTLGLVGVWIGLYISGLRLLRGAGGDGFAYAAGFTLLTQLAAQAALNVAVVTAMVPPKGIPHPLLSYGGSNLVVSLMSIGIVLSLSRGDSGSEKGIVAPAGAGVGTP